MAESEAGKPADDVRQPHADRPWVRACLTACALGGVIGWMLVVFLSGALFQGNDSVTSATVFTASCVLAGSAALLLATALGGPALLIGRGKPLFLAGALVLAASSALGCFPSLRGLPGIVAPVAVGFVGGAGVGLVSLGALSFAARCDIRRGLWILAGAFAVGSLLFCGFMAFVPASWLSAAVTLVAFCSTLLALPVKSTAQEGRAFARSASRSQLRGMLEDRTFGSFAFLASFLFAYCFNVYPKSTHYAGVHTEAFLGVATPAAFMLIATCLFVAGAAAVAWRVSRKRGAYVFGCFLLIALAVLFFTLPNMSTNRAAFVIMGCTALYAQLLVACRTALCISLQDKRRLLECLAKQAAGLVVGALLALAFIELTTESPLVSTTKVVQDAVIVGTPTVGFAVLALLLFRLVQNAVFPPAIPRNDEAASLPDLGTARDLIARTYALTPREGEILGMLLQGRSGPYIAEDLYLSKSTVKTHIRHIYEKIGITSRQQLLDRAQDICRS